jgi:hypothetical protein
MKKFLLNLLSPLNVIIFDYLVKQKFILFCGGGSNTTVIEAPVAPNVGESMKEYLEAVTDPELLGAQLSAESTYGPAFDSVSLARTQTMIEGIKDPKLSFQYLSASAKLKGLETKKAALETGNAQTELDDAQLERLASNIMGPVPVRRTGRGGETQADYNARLAEYNEDKQRVKRQFAAGQNFNSITDIDNEIAAIEGQLAEIEEMPAQKGLRELADESAKAMAETQKAVNRAIREGDIDDLKALGPQAVEALRAADPYSTESADRTRQLSEQATERALEGAQPTAERLAMGELAQRSIDRIATLEALEGKTPAENAELNRLKELRDQQQTSLLDPALARAADPSTDAQRQAMSDLAGQAFDQTQADFNQEQRGALADLASAATAEAGSLEAGAAENMQALSDLGNLGIGAATAAQARAIDPTLAGGRTDLQALANRAQAYALDPSKDPERVALGEMAQSTRDYAASLMAQAQDPATPNAERQRLINEAQAQMSRASDQYGRAYSVNEQQEGLRAQAAQMSQRAENLYAQAEGAPSEERQALRAAANDMMARGKSLFEQSQLADAGQGGLLFRGRAAADDIYNQARQLAQDATGPLSGERRRMAEQAARRQGLRSGRIDDSAQMAAELLGREESRAALRAEAREAAALSTELQGSYIDRALAEQARLRDSALAFETGGFDRARGIEGDIDQRRLALMQEGRLTAGQGFDAGLSIEQQIENQTQARLAEARATQGQAFDQGRAIQSDLDALTADRRAQALAAQQAGFQQTGTVIDADRAMRAEASQAQQTLLNRDEALREEARLERQAAALEQQGLLSEAAKLRDEAATRRSEAMQAQQAVAAFDQGLRDEAATRRGEAFAAQESLAAFDKGLRDEASAAMQEQMRMTAGLMGEEELLRQQQAQEAAQLRGEIAAQQQRAFTQQGQLAQMDEAQRQNLLTEALTATGQAFAQDRAIGGDPANVILGRQSQAVNQGSAAVSQAPAVSQSYQPLFDPSIGLDQANINVQNTLNRNIAQANVDAQAAASKQSMFGQIIGSALMPTP